MLHCPRTLARRIVFSGFFFATGVTSALAADPTGDWKVADGVANIRVAQCNGNMWGAVAWEKTPGGRDTNNPDPVKAEPADARHADPDRHEEEARRRFVGRPSLQRQGRTVLQFDHQARSAPTSSRFKAACWASCAAARPGPASDRRYRRAPVNSMAKGSRKIRRARHRRLAPRRQPGPDARSPARRRPPAPVTPAPKAPGQKPVAGQKQAAADTVGDICLLPDIARFAH